MIRSLPGASTATMQILFEFLPLILFLGAYLIKDIYFAMIVLMVAMSIGLAVKYAQTRKLDKMYFWSTVLLLVFGALALFFRDAAFFYWKPTVFYWAAAFGFLASQLFTDKTLVQRFFDLAGEMPTEQLSPRQWNALNMVWVAFFAFLGGLNIYVAFSFSEAIWVNFKVFGLLGLTVVFLVAQGIWIMSKLQDDEAAESGGS